MTSAEKEKRGSTAPATSQLYRPIVSDATIESVLCKKSGLMAYGLHIIFLGETFPHQ